MRSKLRLMADYDCSPLWVLAESRVDNPDPNSLPLSAELVARLRAWASRFDAILDHEDPASSQFPSRADEDHFNDDGLRLAAALSVELDQAYEVVYRDTRGVSFAIDPCSEQSPDAPPEALRAAQRVVAGPLRSPSEARQLRRLGANAISLLTSTHPVFPDERVLTPSEAEAIAACFGGRSGLLLSPSLSAEELERLLATGWVEFVELDIRFPASEEVLARVKSHELELLISGLTVEYDDDYLWLRDQLVSAADQLGPATFIVTLVPSLRDPTRWFTIEAGRHDEDLTRAQVRAVLDEHPVIVNLGNVERPPERILELFPEARGCYVYLGSPRSDGSNPAFDDTWIRTR